MGALRIWIAVLATVALAASSGTASSAPSTSRGFVGKIALSVQHGDNEAPWDIRVVRTDGRWILRKTTRIDEFNPVLSPDGRHIAFEVAHDGGVYTMNADGTQRRRLARGYEPSVVARWPPDRVCR